MTVLVAHLGAADMPTNRRRRRRSLRETIHPIVIALLKDENPTWEKDDHTAQEAWLQVHWFQREGLRKAWAEVGEEIVAAWAVEHPGTRPSAWWTWSAPQQPGPHRGFTPNATISVPRLRLGGTGDLLCDHTAYVPEFQYGLPVRWVTEKALVTWPSLRGKAIPLDPNDPPIFESEAAYLERHGLLLPGELERLKDDAFEPEAIEIPADR